VGVERGKPLRYVMAKRVPLVSHETGVENFLKEIE
jgi:hypothetical protein